MPVEFEDAADPGQGPPGLGWGTDPGLDHPGRLDDDRNGNGQGAGMDLEHLGAVGVAGIVTVDGAEQHPGVDDDHRGGRSDVAGRLVGEVVPAELLVALGDRPA